MRFINLAIFATGVFAFECFRNSACNALVQLLRLSRFAFLAIDHLLITKRCLHQRNQRNAIDNWTPLSTRTRNFYHCLERRGRSDAWCYKNVWHLSLFYKFLSSGEVLGGGAGTFPRGDQQSPRNQEWLHSVLPDGRLTPYGGYS